MQNDFQEKNKLNPDAVAASAEMKKRLGKMTEYTMSKKLTAKDVELDSDMKDELKALGYIE